MRMRPEKNYHVVTILEHRPNVGPAGAATDIKMLSRSGLVFWVTIAARLDSRSLLDVAILETINEVPVGLEFHPRDVRSGSRTVAHEIVGYRQE